MKVIRLLIADTGMSAFVIVVVKIVGHASLRVGQVGENEPVAQFEQFGFEARPEALGLRVVVAVAPAALRELGFGVAQKLFVDLAHVLATPVGVHKQAGRGPLGQQGSLQSGGNQRLRHVSPHLPAHHLLGAYILKGTAVDPVAIGQGR